MNGETHCACGAAFADRAVKWPGGGGIPGYATRSESKVRICYGCADAAERESMKVNQRAFGYVSASGDLTTWTGGVLASRNGSAPCQLTRQSFTHDRRSYRSRWFRDPSGQRWYGRGSPGICINVRKVGG